VTSVAIVGIAHSHSADVLAMFIFYTVSAVSIHFLTNDSTKNTLHKSLYRTIHLKFYTTYDKLLYFMRHTNNSIPDTHVDA